jgi:peroxiredoxin Q/BCP
MSESVAESVRLQPGDMAPDFTLLDDQNREVSLSSLLGGKVIVYFYPAAMTPGCSKQACDFTASLEQLKARGYTVLGVSPDSPERLAEFRAREGLTLVLLSDPTREVLRSYGAFGTKKLYGKQVEGVIRSTFVVDADGKVEVAQYNVKASGHVDKLRRELDV